MPFLLVAAALIIERQAFNWLNNRNGCDYRIFQKLVEMEVRIEAIDEDSSKEAPPYDPTRYKNHYFYPDFEQLKERMQEDHVQ